MSWVARVLTLLVVTSCGGIVAKAGQGSAAGSAGLPSTGQSVADAGSGSALSGAVGAIRGFGGMGVTGQASVGGSSSGVGGDLAGEGGSSRATADHYAGPLSFAALVARNVHVEPCGP